MAWKIFGFLRFKNKTGATETGSAEHPDNSSSSKTSRKHELKRRHHEMLRREMEMEDKLRGHIILEIEKARVPGLSPIGISGLASDVLMEIIRQTEMQTHDFTRAHAVGKILEKGPRFVRAETKKILSAKKDRPRQ